jgi:NAD(P)H-dependent nitrite reductase small subunit
MTIDLVRVCSVSDVPVGEGRAVRINDVPIAVFNTPDGFRAIDNTCTHMGGPLADGLVADDTVACPLHERRFSILTGDAVGHDCGSVRWYPVQVRGDDVYVTVPLFEQERQLKAV